MRTAGVLAAAAVATLAAGCGGGSHSSTSSTTTAAKPPPAPQTTTAMTTASTLSTQAQPKPPPQPKPKPRPKPRPRPLAPGAVHVTQAGGVTLVSLDQRLVTLHLHSGTVDAGSAGWRYGPAVAGAEAARLLAAFNGGFKLSTGAGGFMSAGRVAVPLRAGLGSIVTYANGTTDIGAWGDEVPARGDKPVSVRQNLGLLIDRGTAAANLDCRTCWGATLGGVPDPARSAVGITRTGRLVYAGGEHLTGSAVAGALLAAHVVRAVELDINPEWVNAYAYHHPAQGGAPVPVPLVPGQAGIPGEFLAPWSRDFFAVVAR